MGRIDLANAATDLRVGECAELLIIAGVKVVDDGQVAGKNLLLEYIKSGGRVGVMRLLAAKRLTLSTSDASEIGEEVGRLFDFLPEEPVNCDADLEIEKLGFVVRLLKNQLTATQAI